MCVSETRPAQVPVYYTVGWWNQTQPVEVALKKGHNTITFSRNTTRVLAFKQFFIYPHKPNIPPPNGNFTPHPDPEPSQCVNLNS